VGDDRRSKRLDFAAAVAILAAKHLPFFDNHPTLLKGSDSRWVARLTDLCKNELARQKPTYGSQTTAVPWRNPLDNERKRTVGQGFRLTSCFLSEARREARGFPDSGRNSDQAAFLSRRVGHQRVSSHTKTEILEDREFRQAPNRSRYEIDPVKTAGIIGLSVPLPIVVFAPPHGRRVQGSTDRASGILCRCVLAAFERNEAGHWRRLCRAPARRQQDGHSPGNLVPAKSQRLQGVFCSRWFRWRPKPAALRSEILSVHQHQQQKSVRGGYLRGHRRQPWCEPAQ
jgi:hypothetical protein